MVADQVEARGILDAKVIRAMRNVPRHLFVPQELRTLSYGDFPLPIGEGQTISQPYMVAVMTEALSLRSGDRVLEIGTGSGYQAAVLAEIADEVYTIEIIPSLASKADSILKQLGYSNISVKTGDGYVGWEEYAPFDAIIVTCAPPHVPEPLIEQLADSGRLVVPVGEEGEVQTLILVEKIRSEILQSPLLPCIFVPMRSHRITPKR
jgi:protein-L-isoaspartate(D-aspartate) O-methyltransferase